MKKVRHVLGISGGKDSAALAIYLRQKYPRLEMEYYCCDTGKELPETYKLVEDLEIFLGKKIVRLNAVPGYPGTPFDYYLDTYRGYLPSNNARWCTKKLKLSPFEQFVGDDPVISYVGIRGDEDRDGYISKKSNIQSIFPFRQKIWSEDVIEKVLNNKNIPAVMETCRQLREDNQMSEMMAAIFNKETSVSYTRERKASDLLSYNVKAFNQVVFRFLQATQYPLSMVEDYALLDNTDVLKRDDIFKILEDSGVGVPEYYRKIQFTVDGKTGQYARSRSGCYFCFFQQKIEWVWLHEQHPDLFQKAMDYEKGDFTWNQEERLEDLIKPARVKKIKEDYIVKMETQRQAPSEFLLDLLITAEDEGCAACFL